MKNQIIRKTCTLLIAIFLFGLCSFGNNQSVIIENDFIKVSINEYGALSFEDKVNNVSWGNEFPGWVEFTDQMKSEQISLKNSEVDVRKRKNSIIVKFMGIEGKEFNDPQFLMKVNIGLTDKKIELTIDEVKTNFSLKSIEYPSYILNYKSGLENTFIVVPSLQGIIIPGRYDAGFMRYGQNVWDAITDKEAWWSFESGNLNMPWFGATIGNSSILAHVETSSDCKLHVIGNKIDHDIDFKDKRFDSELKGTRISSLSPVWMASMQELSYKRKMTFELVKNGYVGMAKKYKEYAIKSGRYVTMKEKIEENPQIKKIIGAPDIKFYCFTNRIDEPLLKAGSEPVLNGYTKVNTSFSQAAEMATELSEMGVDKCMILLSGWNRMGYDREYPDIWPPATECGGIEGLKNASEIISDLGYIFALQDNYDDFYFDAPSYHEDYIVERANGTLLDGRVWDGGPCQIICPAKRLELLKSNLDLILPNVSLNGHYFDVLTNTSHLECYNELHRVHRKEDLKYRYEILKTIYEKNIVPGGERGADWAIPVSAFFEGLSGGGTGYHRGVSYRTGLTVPLFYLVYHECIVGYWQHGTPSGREDHANHVLLDLLYAQPSSWSLEYSQWNDLKPLIKECYELVSKLHEKTAFSAMTIHRYLSQDYMVQETEFDDGTKVVVNFGIEGYQYGDTQIPPKGFILNIRGTETKIGRVSRNIIYK